MNAVYSADKANESTLTLERCGTAGPSGGVRLVRVQINCPIIGEVGINLELDDLLNLVDGVCDQGRDGDRAEPDCSCDEGLRGPCALHDGWGGK